MSGKVTMYTDGACKGNPGPGGWGVVLRYGAKVKMVEVPPGPPVMSPWAWSLWTWTPRSMMWSAVLA